MTVKRIFRKNQLIITALALMIAVAGYFSYMDKDMDDNEIAANAGADVLEENFEISDEDILLEEDIFVAEEGTVDGEIIEGDIAGLDESTDVASAETSEVASGEYIDSTLESAETPGEAVLTSTTVTNIDYASDMKLSREQVRSKNKETLLEIVNNTSITDDLKQDAINKMIALTDIAERENAAEMLLEAKGFTDVVVSITGESCDVVLNMGEVTDAKRAQVEDIVKRKTNIAAENIIITPIVIQEANAN